MTTKYPNKIITTIGGETLIRKYTYLPKSVWDIIDNAALALESSTSQAIAQAVLQASKKDNTDDNTSNR